MKRRTVLELAALTLAAPSWVLARDAERFRASWMGARVPETSGRPDDLAATLLDSLAELAPQLSCVALLNDAPSANEREARAAALYEWSARTAASGKGLAFIATSARDSEGVQRAFAEIERAGADGLVVAASAPLFQLRREIIAHARRLRLPTVTALREWMEAGGQRLERPGLQLEIEANAAK